MVASKNSVEELKRIEKQMPLRNGQFQNRLVGTTKFHRYKSYLLVYGSMTLLQPAKILLCEENLTVIPIWNLGMLWS